MCDTIELEDGVVNVRPDIIMWVAGVTQIVLGVLALCLFWYEGTGFNLIFEGVYVIIVIFLPFFWMIIWCAVCQIICIVYMFVQTIRYFMFISYHNDHIDKNKGGEEWSFGWPVSMLILSIFNLVVAVPLLIVLFKGIRQRTG